MFGFNWDLPPLQTCVPTGRFTIQLGAPMHAWPEEYLPARP